MQDDLLDLIAGMQSKRMDEQRVALPHLPGLHPPAQSQVLQRLSVAGMGGDGSTAPDDTFLEMLMRCQVSPFLPPRGNPNKVKKMPCVGRCLSACNLTSVLKPLLCFFVPAFICKTELKLLENSDLQLY